MLLLSIRFFPSYLLTILYFIDKFLGQVCLEMRVFELMLDCLKSLIESFLRFLPSLQLPHLVIIEGATASAERTGHIEKPMAEGVSPSEEAVATANLRCDASRAGLP